MLLNPEVAAIADLAAFEDGNDRLYSQPAIKMIHISQDGDNTILESTNGVVAAIIKVKSLEDDDAFGKPYPALQKLLPTDPSMLTITVNPLYLGNLLVAAAKVLNTTSPPRVKLEFRGPERVIVCRGVSETAEFTGLAMPIPDKKE